MRRRNGFRTAPSAVTCWLLQRRGHMTAEPVRSGCCSSGNGSARSLTCYRGRNGEIEIKNGVPLSETPVKLTSQASDLELKEKGHKQRIQAQRFNEGESDDHRAEESVGAVGVTANRFHRRGREL